MGRIVAYDIKLRMFSQGLTYFPMVPERIYDSSDSPTVWLIADGPNNGCSRFDSLIESGIGIFDDHNYSRRTAPKGFRAEILMFWRFISEPKFSSFY